MKRIHSLNITGVNAGPSDMTISEILYGTHANFNDTCPSFYSLEAAINKLSKSNNQCLLTIGNSEPCYTDAIIQDKDQIYMYLFDSKSRGDTGMLEPDGVHSMHDRPCEHREPLPFQ